MHDAKGDRVADNGQHDDPIGRVHQRLDDLFQEFAAMREDMSTIKTACGPCRDAIRRHDSTLYGNGQAGLVSRMLAAEQGRVDTLSVASVVKILGAVGALAGAIAGAVGGLVAALVR